MKNQLWDQRVSAAVAALTGYLAPAQIVRPAVNPVATVKQSQLYLATRKHASNRLAQTSASVRLSRFDKLCMSKTSFPESD
jgi:hypothetical protein